VKLQRNGSKALAIGAMALVGSLSLAACGTDDNSTSSTGSSAAASGAAPAAQIACGKGGQLLGAGSTAQTNAVDVWKAAFGSACSGSTITYGGGGSGAGVQQFNQGKVAFAGSDSALKPAEVDASKQVCTGGQGVNLPMVGGLISIVFNVENVDKLVLDGQTVAKIFDSQITKWNDPAIAALNSGAALPDSNITPIYRSDSSGTTDNFQKYLGVAAPEAWTKGAGSEFQGGAGEGAQKSAGVVQAVQATPGAIGYVEKGFATQAKLPMAQIDTGAGAVELTDDAARKAIDAAKFAAEGNDLVLDLNSLYGTKEAGAYPLVLATYEIVCSKGYDADTTAAVKSFLTVASDKGQAGLADAGYISLPDAFKQRLVTSIDAIQ
jgi:phosphate transport system substrate-binding protein